VVDISYTLSLLFRAPVSRKKLCVRSSTRSPDEDVVAVPRPAVRVLRQRALAAGDEVLRIADSL
jgi:hypothetical protein